MDLSPMSDYEAATQKARRSKHVPGCSSIAIFRDQVLQVGSFGKADLEYGTEMSTDSCMRLYCLSKPMVATALMTLVEAGKCRLDDEVSKYIPEFKDIKVCAKPSQLQATAQDRKLKHKLTLRRLMTHCSGLGYGPVLGMDPAGAVEAAYAKVVECCDSGRIDTLKKLCEALAALPLRFQPGEKYFYSYGLDVIGRVIEVVSRKPLDQFLQETLFKPLGMRDTGFCVSPEKSKKQLTGLYASLHNKRSMGESITADVVRHPAPCGTLVRVDGDRPDKSAWVSGRSCPVLSGGGIMGTNRGGLLSTVSDQTRFYMMLLRGGQLAPGYKRLLKPGTIEQMWSADWLTDKKAVGRTCRDGRKVFGWHALGETGIVHRPRRQIYPDFFQFGQWGMAGAACTHVTVDLKQRLLCLWFTQTLEGWPGWTAADEKQNLWAAAKKVVDLQMQREGRPHVAAQKRKSSKLVATETRAKRSRNS